MATVSAAESSQFQMLPAEMRERILADYAANGGSGPPPSISMVLGGKAITGPVFKGDANATSEAVGPLTRTDVSEMLGVKEQPAQQIQAAPQVGALTQAAPARAVPDIAEMLRKYMPQDDSQSRYLALAQGFGRPTQTGTFAETMSNVASAMSEQKQSQDKLRSQYVPLIMQQVAAQQAREEQNAYRLEAAQQAQQAQALLAQQNRQAMAASAALAQQGRVDLASQNQKAADERAAAERALREQSARDKPPPMPHFMDRGDGTMVAVGADGRGSPVIDSSTGKPVTAKPPKSPMSAALQKELLESDDALQSSKVVENLLNQALGLNDLAYSGYAAKGRATVRSNLPGESKEADATINFDNILTGQALDSLKAIFGGMPTEGERKILLDMQASVDKTPEQRKAIVDRAIKAAQTRGAYAAQKAKAIRDGSYLTDGMGNVPPPVGAGPAPVSGLPSSDAIAAEIARRKKG